MNILSISNPWLFGSPWLANGPRFFHPATSGGFLQIFRLCAPTQMARIDTSRVVAAVQRVATALGRGSMGFFADEVVRPSALHRAVTVILAAIRPQQAVIVIVLERLRDKLGMRTARGEPGYSWITVAAQAMRVHAAKASTVTGAGAFGEHTDFHVDDCRIVGGTM